MTYEDIIDKAAMIVAGYAFVNCGEYIEVISGLQDDDWLAFPYEKSAKAGAKTKHSTQISFFYVINLSIEINVPKIIETLYPPFDV